MLSFSERVDLLIRVVLAVAVSIGCYFIIEPFLTAIVIAAILARRHMAALRERRSSAGGSTTLPALLMVFLLIIGVLIPSSFLLIALAQQIPKGISVIREWIASGFTIPPAISEIPGIGPWLHDQLLFAIDPASLSTTMQKLLEPLSAALLNAAVNVSNILLQLALVTFIVFFFYRDGAWFADRVQALMKRVSGDLSNELTKILVNTTRSVVFGLVGTALGQAVVAGIGFWIAGVPGILMLWHTRLRPLDRPDRTSPRLGPVRHLALLAGRNGHGRLPRPLGAPRRSLAWTTSSSRSSSRAAPHCPSPSSSWASSAA